MSTEALIKPVLPEDIERVLIGGDLSALNPSQRLIYYKAVCESVGLNPLTKPFDFLTLNGKLILYANKNATEQLRRVHGVSVYKLERDKTDDTYAVTAYGKDATGREDAALGVVTITNLRGDNLANAMMKAETKAKRRLTLSMCGLGMLDETEVETIPGAQRVALPLEPEDESQEPLPLSPQTLVDDAFRVRQEKFTKAMEEARKKLDDDETYFDVLRQRGFEDSFAVKDYDEMKAIYKEVMDLVAMQHLAQPTPEDDL